MAETETPAAVGDLVFLVECVKTGETRVLARRRPIRTNVSHEPRLRGWVGETDNVSRTALGAGIVTRISPESGREWHDVLLVRRLPDTDERVAAAFNASVTS
jgi:hypothetical protein